MNTISYKRLREFAKLHKDAEASMAAWYKIAKKTAWRNIVEVRGDYPHADIVGKYVVFNVGGNKYRVVTESILHRS